MQWGEGRKVGQVEGWTTGVCHAAIRTKDGPALACSLRLVDRKALVAEPDDEHLCGHSNCRRERGGWVGTNSQVRRR